MQSGIWIVEFSYFPLLLKNLTFAQINHEHVTYYTLTTFNNIAKKNGLKIVDVNFNEINGGSAEVTVCKKNSKHKVNKKKLETIFREEKDINSQSYEKFNLRLQNVKQVVTHFFSHTKDDNKQKWGRYTPGSNIKIISKQKMRKMNPKYLFVLIWSFRSEVIKQEIKYLQKGGKLVFPLPIFHIIDKNNYKYFINKKVESFAFSI